MSDPGRAGRTGRTGRREGTRHRNDGGTRVLIDRLRPRGVSREQAGIDEWPKDITPSKELRSWHHEDRTGARCDALADRYRAELADPVRAAAVDRLVGLVREGGPVTLVTAVKGAPHSHAPVLVGHPEHELRHHH
ncbi:DUF488 domain-containing protein [Streptomyces sp. NPDC056061]|uniref:DUF488 domain-containing protein n=1 Tax=Streptomyces sp. NPDC056061 TaxID=3345700 RepID=UPI0035E17E4D